MVNNDNQTVITELPTEMMREISEVVNKYNIPIQQSWMVVCTIYINSLIQSKLSECTHQAKCMLGNTLLSIHEVHDAQDNNRIN